MKHCYLVVYADDLELPCACFDTAIDVADYLMCDRTYVHNLIRYGTAYKKRYKVYKIKFY